MNDYYLTLLIKNELDDKGRKALLDSVTKNFGKLVKEDLWGVRSLAYPINHQDKAYYAHYEFQTEPAKISEIDKMVKLNEDIIRYLILHIEPKKRAQKAPKRVRVEAKSEAAKSEGADVEEVVKEEKKEEVK